MAPRFGRGGPTASAATTIRTLMELAITVVLAAVLLSIPAMPPLVALGVLAVIAAAYIIVHAR
jgi:hypothetical protein